MGPTPRLRVIASAVSAGRRAALGSVWFSAQAYGLLCTPVSSYPHHSHRISSTSSQRRLLFGRGPVLNVLRGTAPMSDPLSKIGLGCAEREEVSPSYTVSIAH